MAANALSSVVFTIAPIANVYLLGDLVEQIVGKKLPSKRQALGFMLYTIRTDCKVARESARITVRDVLKFWDAARIPTQTDSKCVDKLLKLYHEYQQLGKNKNRQKRKTKTPKELKFCNELDDLFDIAAQNAFDRIERPDDKNFLLQQRMKGRPGRMIDISEEFTKEMENRRKRAKKLEKVIYMPRSSSKSHIHFPIEKSDNELNEEQ